MADKLNFFSDMHWSWSFTVYVGFALIIWIQVQMQFIKMVNWLHVVYSMLGVVIVAVALLPQLRRLYGK